MRRRQQQDRQMIRTRPSSDTSSSDIFLKGNWIRADCWDWLLLLFPQSFSSCTFDDRDAGGRERERPIGAISSCPSGIGRMIDRPLISNSSRAGRRFQSISGVVMITSFFFLLDVVVVLVVVFLFLLCISLNGALYLLCIRPSRLAPGQLCSGETIGNRNSDPSPHQRHFKVLIDFDRKKMGSYHRLQLVVWSFFLLCVCMCVELYSACY